MVPKSIVVFSSEAVLGNAAGIIWEPSVLDNIPTALTATIV
jgi:hypothetical protein